jgi:hypothetical protein
MPTTPLVDGSMDMEVEPDGGEVRCDECGLNVARFSGTRNICLDCLGGPKTPTVTGQVFVSPHNGVATPGSSPRGSSKQSLSGGLSRGMSTSFNLYGQREEEAAAAAPRAPPRSPLGSPRSSAYAPLPFSSPPSHHDATDGATRSRSSSIFSMARTAGAADQVGVGFDFVTPREEERTGRSLTRAVPGGGTVDRAVSASPPGTPQLAQRQRVRHRSPPPRIPAVAPDGHSPSINVTPATPVLDARRTRTGGGGRSALGR